MDPLSITTAVDVCWSVKEGLDSFISNCKLVGTAVNAIQQDVRDFTKILELMKETAEDEKVKNSMTSSGYVGTYWEYLNISLADANKTLEALSATVNRVNKDVKILDTPRKARRLEKATREIGIYQQQIRSYKDTIHISMQTTLM
jgi:uncharacterized protein YoxC